MKSLPLPFRLYADLLSLLAGALECGDFAVVDEVDHMLRATGLTFTISVAGSRWACIFVHRDKTLLSRLEGEETQYQAIDLPHEIYVAACRVADLLIADALDWEHNEVCAELSDRE